MSKTITIALCLEDAEPMLRQAAKEAAEFGALLDYVTRKTGNVRQRNMGERYDDARARWQKRYLKAKRMVEAFGIEYEPISEGEALTVGYRYVGGKTTIRRMPGIGPVQWTEGSKPDYDHPYPEMRGEIMTQACIAAADRVVRRWREAHGLALAA